MHWHAPGRAGPSLFGDARSPPPDLQQQLLVIKTDHAVNCKCSDHSTYPTSHGPYRLVVDLGPADAPPEPPSRSPPFRPTAEGGPPLQLRPCFRRPHLQFGRSTFFWYFAVFIAPCEKYTYRTVNKQQYIHTPIEYKTLTLTSSTSRLAARSTLAASSVSAISSWPAQWSPR